MGRVNVDFYRSVRLNITPDQARQYQPFRKGLDVNFYEPLNDRGENLLKLPGYNTKKINTLDVTITAKSINPDPLHEREMRDIDEELAMLDSTYRVVQDHLKTTDNDRLTHLHQPVETLIRHATILDHPYLDGENDHLRSTAQEVHDVEVPVEDLRAEEERLARRKAFYNRSKLNYVSKLGRATVSDPVPRKTATMKVGYI
jgi:hypothetical protein